MPSMKPTFLFRTLALAVFASACAAPAFAASARDAKKVPRPAAPKPAIRVDNTPVGEGGKAGLVMSYADVIEPAQKAVVSVYSTKIIKERIIIDPLFRRFFGNIPDQERESRLEGLG